MTARVHRWFMLLCLLFAGLLVNSMANAHEGEDHGDEGKRPAPNTAIAPRAPAQTDDFELVVLLDEGPSKSSRLLITLDRFKTNEPVVGAKLEVDAGGQSLPAQELSPGVYGVQLAALNRLAPSAKLPLTVTVETTDSSDLLTTTLELAAPAPSASPEVHGRVEYVVRAAGATLILAVGIVLLVRRRYFKKQAS